jgi:hypothetical protein
MKLIPKQSLDIKDSCNLHGCVIHTFIFVLYKPKTHSFVGHLFCNQCHSYAKKYNLNLPYFEITFDLENWLEFTRQFHSDCFLEGNSS